MTEFFTGLCLGNLIWCSVLNLPWYVPASVAFVLLINITVLIHEKL